MAWHAQVNTYVVEVCFTANRVRGRGRALNSLFFYNQPFASSNTQIYLQLYLWSLLYYGFLLSRQFWQAWALLPEKHPKDHKSLGFEPNVFFVGKLLSPLLFKMNVPKKLRI